MRGNSNFLGKNSANGRGKGVNYEAYRNRRVAALFYGPFCDLPTGLSHWAISDLDAFYENLGLWSSPDTPLMELLFSIPITGVRQHLANCRLANVGLAGQRLRDISDAVKSAYLCRGYDVLEIDGNNENYTICEPDDCVRIVWRSL